ncbi:hypothetical protein AUEXF2481DRAFT_39072 [Aureobasidium subglaciale EXF-2481]|uniref:DNA mismatch repair protein HSM3 N-terminal domain-containing protein n=1 Tax=Aureobasidium subglaciale (strain EXF-2481) TaxID=1043005 RepID=A0A074YE13_AURSE|nr:uncharacterized protein AUEXF2481DRAFT_39072 [Aureobasidium subglaciale EXF-2481]KAI5210948.1 hypothetical protein E4T38_01605 [Aureobasidium subglaciale]KAI5219119.1 hypothetical protein E4T40_06544 [Aureobasidium subglaciale]KAI5233265.1 hypothetical protein E4T41_01603 [Aureobasidium subglaciale]KAI5260096.1 hypothetical protein E4T46_06344 [Aureobasidium subglaciale]KEQ95990.1 hypothetical protein AUEXF2481DRAFT_39072 [Aureobasidium subglaciale EXF-2481]
MAASNDLLERLQAHLGQLEADPINTEIDERLFESCSLALAPGLSKKDSMTLVPQLSRILPVLQKDPTQPIQFLVLLLEPLNFADVLGLNAAVDFVGGLNVVAVPYNRLMLALLSKAAGNATDAATIAAQPEVVTALVNLWLCTHDAGIAKQAGDVLLALLKIDHAVPPGAGEEQSLPGHSQGLMWKRVFGDQDVYALIFSVCSLKHTEGIELSGSQRSLAQARLLEWLPEVGALNWNAITHAHHPEVEKRYTDGKGEGLLYFSTVCMIDTAGDVLMHCCLVEFYATFLGSVTTSASAGSSHSSAALDFLIQHKLHEKAMSFYLDPTNPRHDPLDVQFLYAPSANYLATYVSSYPSHFLASTLKQTLTRRLLSSLDLTPSRWAHAESPKHDLHILASMPRSSLLPPNNNWMWSPLSLLPSKSTNADVLATLATIFHGPSKQEIINYPASSPLMDTTHDAVWKSEAQAAYALYYLYLNHNPTLFADLAHHASIIALRENALASISLIRSIATANWLPLTDNSTPTASDFHASLPPTALAEQQKGFLAILSPPSLEYTLPYLLSPAQTFSNLVGGVGDTENSAYRVAMSKFECLKEEYNRLKVFYEEGGEEGKEWADVVVTLRKKVDEGPFGSRQGEVGGRIATMEL